MKKTAYKTNALEMAFESAAFNAAIFNLRPFAEVLRLRMQANSVAMPVNENEELYRELESRYGPGYAQAIMDGMKKSCKN